MTRIRSKRAAVAGAGGSTIGNGTDGTGAGVGAATGVTTASAGTCGAIGARTGGGTTTTGLTGTGSTTDVTVVSLGVDAWGAAETSSTGAGERGICGITGTTRVGTGEAAVGVGVGVGVGAVSTGDATTFSPLKITGVKTGTGRPLVKPERGTTGAETASTTFLVAGADPAVIPASRKRSSSTVRTPGSPPPLL